MGYLWTMWKKNIDQAKLLWDSWNVWGTKFNSMPLPECNIPATEMLFSEAPMVSRNSYKNNKEND